ncbi:GNAT family N-acetyltransferase [Azospirillum agricola]|uniref:GNAT family N-acetyltransferase n=1 Tax=Azospirillum agricola TaxID=1720247 RepID=UPI000A0F37D7|nr:GNAT family N-acetyltransferase [Azospirillum agricola]SMH59601.1 Ribosomal protein S18 acetylase RimI [Azospirillum lipoferum]
MADGGWGFRMRPASATTDPDTLSLTVAIRPARADDLPVLEWFGLHTAHREIIGNAFRMQERGVGAMLLAEVNGFPAGQICVDFMRKRHLGRATLWALRVFQPFRGAGLGSRLMRAAEEVVAERGGGVAELGVDRDNAGVLPFYDRLGYLRCGTERGHFSYHTPDGVLVRVVIDQWLLHKRVAPAQASVAILAAE